MIRAAKFLVLLFAAFTAVSWASAHAQDPQPSLGDVARAARKDKEKNAADTKKVYTDENLASSNGRGGLSDGSSSSTASDASPSAKALAAVDRVEETLDKLDPLDRATLAKAALLDNDVDFPGRAAWEDKLFAAKQHYVSHGRELVTQMRQILTDAHSLKSQNGQAKLSSQDPRAQEMIHRLQELVQDAVRTDNTYQAVVLEGWDRAKQAKH